MNRIIIPRLWKPLTDPDFGLMTLFSRSIEAAETRDKNYLPDLRRGSVMFVASDYSGQNDFADYQSLSFLFADLNYCNTWEKKRQILRQQYLADGRRMAFKNLNDNKRWKALPAFLEAADTIPGLVATILIDKRINNLFKKSGSFDMNQPELRPYSHWKQSSFIKVLSIIHFVSFFIAGLSAPNQDIIWITDEDEIAANESRLRELTTLWGNILSHYTQHNLRHLRCGTTRSDNGSREIEDLASIPDLIAGTLTELLTMQRAEGLLPKSTFIVPPPKRLSKKTIEIMNWFSTTHQPLKRLVFVVEPVTDSTELLVKRLQFHNENGGGTISLDIAFP